MVSIGTKSLQSLRAIIVCGPSGCGKSTLVKRLLTEYSDKLGYSVSHTSRAKRPGETDGIEYYFVDKDEFEQMIKQGEFVEYAQYSGNYYGTSYQTLRDQEAKGKVCVLEIEIEGVKQIIHRPEIRARYVFVHPPSLEILRNRLTSRGTETSDIVEKRMRKAVTELEFAQHNASTFQAHIINDDLEKAYMQLKAEVDDYLKPQAAIAG